LTCPPAGGCFVEATGRGKVTKEFRCADAGLFPDCDGVMQGETEDEILAKAADHGKQVHGMTDADFDPATIEKVRSAIHDV
jgi:predicted small metal-binding protein